MLDDLRIYISEQLVVTANFFDTVTNRAKYFDATKHILRASELELSNLGFETTKILLDLLVRQFTGEDWMTISFTDGHQKSIVKVLKSVKPAYSADLISYLDDINILPTLQYNLNDKSADIRLNGDYYSAYIEAVKSHLSNIEPPTVSEIIKAEFVFQHINKSANHYSKISPVYIDDDIPKVKFLYSTRTPFIPANSNDPAHNGVGSIGYFSYILLRLEDDYTFNNKVIFKKSDFPTGVLLTGIELYWMHREQYNFLKSSFNAWMVAGIALAVTGPELAVAKGWKLILAVIDFQAAVKMFVSQSPLYQQLYQNNPNIRGYLDAWDDFNKIYGVCRITQVTAELAITKWAAVKSAANNVKNDATILPSVKNELKVSEIADGVVNPNLVNSLKGKLTEPGYATLQAWKSGKTITTIDELGQTISGTQAEARLLTELDTKLGGSNILETVNENISKRLIIRTDATGVGKVKVFTVEKNATGNYVINEYKATYIKGGQPGYPPLSVNKTTPDFSLNSNGTWLHPQTAGNTIKIRVSGQMNTYQGVAGDVQLANEAAGITGTTTPEFYTWHHMDDFNPATGECTMQLVKTDIHNLCKPHSGAVKQWENYTGNTYRRN
jgi:hypothetical protein